MRLDDYINFTNIDDEDFSHKYAKEEYTIKSGETKVLPRFLAVFLAKHLMDKILLKKGVQDYMSPDLRKPLAEKILGEVVWGKETPVKKPLGRVIKERIEREAKEFEDLEAKRQEEIRVKRLEALKKAREAKKKKSKK